MPIANRLVVLLGSNSGDRLQLLSNAQQLLTEKVGSLIGESAVYETAAWGKTDQNHFLNKVLILNTLIEPDSCLNLILAIELELGRQRKAKWAERTIDIDILFYNVERLEKENLTIPHPFIHLRKFTLAPLAEIIPEFIHPVLNKTMQELYQECTDPLEVSVFSNL